jgi:hypothetical protein
VYSRVLLDNDLCEIDRRNVAEHRSQAIRATALQDATVMSLEGNGWGALARQEQRSSSRMKS